MAQIKINVGAVIGLSPTATSAKNTVANVKSYFNSTRNQVDGRVLNRNNLGNRMSSVSSQLSSIENRIISKIWSKKVQITTIALMFVLWE